MNKITKQLDDARVALEAAKAKLADVQKGELASISTPAAFEAWRRERDAAFAEEASLRNQVIPIQVAGA
ncbi:hypothetical protein [Bradyrhizobium sp. AZCC 1721]|uniref:hypothetical protein n=1 Tax=Bradyrhizobium sp. AZCC 1721 TaxID=3117016 RepID=UPI002FF39D8A